MKNNGVRLTIFQLLNQNYHLWRNIQSSMNGVNIEELTTNISGKVSFTLWLKNINTNHCLNIQSKIFRHTICRIYKLRLY